MKQKHIAIKLLVAFFAAAVLMTWASRQIYCNTLPKVTVGSQSSAVIAKIVKVSGTLHYEYQTTYTVPVACKVEKVYLDCGSKVTTDSRIMKLSLDDLEEARYELAAQIDTLKQQKKAETSGSSQYNLTSYQQREAQKELNQVNDIIKHDGDVVSTQDGIVTQLDIKAGNQLEKGATAAATASRRNTLEITWDMSKSQAASFKKGDSITLALSIMDANDKVSSKNYSASISSMVYSHDDDAYLCTCYVKLAEGDYSGASEGDSVSVTAKYVSDSYAYTVPLSAVDFSDDTSGTVYVLCKRREIFGTEYYVKNVSVTVEDYDNKTAAVSDAVDFDSSLEVVTYASKTLEDGQAVQVEGD